MSSVESTETSKLGGAGKALTLVDVVAQSVGFMGPVFSIAFLVPLVVGLASASQKGAGVAAPLAIFIAGLGVLAIAWLVGAYAKRIHAAGALYDYVTDGLGSKIGGAAGFLYYLGILALGSAILMVLAGTIHDTLAGEFQFTAIPVTGWAIILLVLSAATMFFGVALSTRAQFILALVSILTVLIFSIHVIAQVGSNNNVSTAFSPSNAPEGWAGVAFGIVYAILLFTGFETAANLGEETAQPKRDIPRAVIASVIVVGAFYLIASYAQVAGYGFNLEAMGKNAGAPLFGLAAPVEAGGYGGVWIARLLELVVVLDMLAVLIGCSVAASRGIFAMSRDERFPGILGKVSRRGTPWNAGVVVLVVYVIAIAVSKFFPTLFAIPGLPHYFAMFSWGSSFGGLGLAIIYFLLCVGALRGLRDHDRYGAVVVASVIGMIVTAAAIFGAVYQVGAPTIYAAYAVVVVFIVGLILSFVVKGKAPITTTYDELTVAERGPQKL